MPIHVAVRLITRIFHVVVVDKEHVLLHSFDIFIFFHQLVILEIVINVSHQGSDFRSHTMLYV